MGVESRPRATPRRRPHTVDHMIPGTRASPQRVGLCTDSNAQLPPSLVERYAVEIVPVTITVDDEEYLEGVDLDADAFYARFEQKRRPRIGTSQPSPGQFALAYEQLLARGCTEILSIHVASGMSGTLNSARLAAHRLGAPVRLVDSGTAGFGIGCCVWSAGDALARGASVDEAAAVAESVALTLGNVFVVGSLEVLRAGGRLAVGASTGPIPVLELRSGSVEVVAEVDSVLEAVNAMASAVIGFGSGLRVAVGHADAATEAIADALELAVGETAVVDEVIRYRVGPSVGVHTGPGTVGCFMFPSVR
jgi:DegV family protein with EDD domain